MAIVNTILPERVSLARSPVLVKLASNLPTTSKPVNELRWVVAGSPAVGEALTMSYGGVSVTITVLATADDTGNTISQQGALSLAAYAQQLVTELNRNATLFANFLITYDLQGSTHRIIFAPRGSTELTWAHSGSLSNITVSIQELTNSVYLPSPAILLLVEIYNHTTGEYDAPLSHVLPILESSQLVAFDIMADFNLGPALPPASTIGTGGDFISALTANWTKYRLYYAERQGVPPATKKLATPGQEYYAIYGGQDFFNQFNSFWDFWSVNGKFLTAAPRTQSVTYSQPIWLYWVGRESRDIEVYVQATHRSGSTSTYQRDTYSEVLGEIVAVKAGFEQLQLPEDPADPIVSYKVYLRSDSQAISEVFTFSVAGDCAEFTRYFLFANSLGGCDTVRATGKHTTRIEVITQTGTKIVAADTAQNGMGEDFEYNRRSRALFEGSVGYKSATYIAYLQDLLNAPAVWLIDTVNGRFTPVLISAESFELFKDGEDLYTLRFRYRHAWEDAHAGITDDGQRIITLGIGQEDIENDIE